MFDEIKKSVFKIVTALGTGTGFKIKGYDFIITNYHVIKGFQTIALENQDKDRFLGKVIMVNPSIDLAFIYSEDLKKISSKIELDEKLDVKVTSKVYICGFPFGMPSTITEGIISAVNQPINDRFYLQTDAAINPGNSGGPMVDKNNCLIAVTTSKFQNADNVGFGIKHTDLLKELKDYKPDYDEYKVKCSSCDNYIKNKMDFCDSCGTNISSSVFNTYELSDLAIFIEDSLKETKLEPILCRVGENYWSFSKEKSLIRIFISNEDYLIATSPLNEMPKSNLKGLLTYINSQKVYPFMFGISDNKIYISYRLHLSDIYSLSKEKIRENLKRFIDVSSQEAIFLNENFNCEFSIETKV